MSPADSPSTKSGSPRLKSSQPWSRRAVLATVGTVTASTLAGCNTLRNDSDTAPFHDGDWRSYGNGVRNANRVASGAPEPDEHQILSSGGWSYTPPVVHGDVVYFAADRQVTAVRTDGSDRWSRDLEAEVSGTPALDPVRGRLYVPTRIIRTSNSQDPVPASVTVLSLSDGDIVSTLRVGGRRTYGVTVGAGDVYARSATTCVRLAPDGTERWRRSLNPLIYDEYNLGDSTATQIAPAVTEEGVYVPDRNALVKLDLKTGKERWRIPVDTPYAASVIDNDGVVQTGWRETVAATHSGEVRWRRDLHSRAAATAAANGDIYIAAHDLHELHPETGESNWQAHLPNEGTAAPVVTEETVLAPTGDVRAFRRDIGGFLGPSRERWRASTIHAAAYSSPVIAAGRVFVVSPTGLVALRSGEDS